MARINKQYAGVIVRALAVAIDAMMLMPASVLISKLIGDNLMFAALANLIVGATYYVVFLSGHWQATPGKRIAGIYVMNEDGSPLNQQQALQRYLAYILPSLPVYSSLETSTSAMIMVWMSVAWFLPVLLMDNKTAIHDLLCNTRVVHGKAEEKR